MPRLEELSLSIELAEFVPNRNAQSHDLRLRRLKYFFLDATCCDCAVLLDRFTFNPGCVLDIHCAGLHIDEHYESVGSATYHYAADFQLDVCVTIALEQYEITLIVWPTSSSSNVGNFNPVFRFAATVSKYVIDSWVEDDGGYWILFLLVRMAYLMKLTKCSELHLNVDLELPDRFAPILGPLIRACKNAKRAAQTIMDS